MCVFLIQVVPTHKECVSSWSCIHFVKDRQCFSKRHHIFPCELLNSENSSVWPWSWCVCTPVGQIYLLLSKLEKVNHKFTVGGYKSEFYFVSLYHKTDYAPITMKSILFLYCTSALAICMSLSDVRFDPATFNKRGHLCGITF